MKPLTFEWIQKAEADFITAQREYAATEYPNYDAACFHAQQCAEKYLKARLVEAEIPFGKTHDLAVVLSLALPVESTWDSMRNELDALTDRAVEVRYPGISADVEDAKEAIETARKIRELVRNTFEL